MQNAAAFIITYRIKHRFLIRIKETHQVFLVAAALQVTSHIRIILGISGILTIFIFIPQRLAIIGKRFIQRQVAPAFEVT